MKTECTKTGMHTRRKGFVRTEAAISYYVKQEYMRTLVLMEEMQLVSVGLVMS